MLIIPLPRHIPIPYDLLLLADPSIDAINKYFSRGYCYIAMHNDNIIATYVLYPLGENEIEIKNISVSEDFQRKGIGKQLLQHAESVARAKGFSLLIIGTSDTNSSPLKLYSKMGFEKYAIKKFFFTNNYPEPIYENGEQCIDMIMLKKQL